MDEQREPVVTIVNKNYPPGTGITGESANEMAGWLLDHGVQVNVIHSDGRYGGGGNITAPNGRTFLVKSLYDGKNKIIRLFSSFVESYFLIRKAKRITKKGWIIVMTDPPFLIFWASVLLKKKKWAYWSMDLYPEAFIAGRLITERNFLYRFFKRKVKENPPDYMIALGVHQLNYLRKEYARKIPATILPCGVKKSGFDRQTLPDWKSGGKIVLGYCGNIGEAHSADFLLEIINTLDAEKFTLVLALYGSKSGVIKEAARDRKGVVIKDSVPRHELTLIDVHLVTLLPEWNNICVPSKAVSAVCEGGTIMFCGDKENDNWEYLQEAAWLVKDDADLKVNIKEVLSRISKESILEKKRSAVQVSRRLLDTKEGAFRDIHSFLQALQHSN
ncbi:MAG: hypothetical protein KIT80_05450 [Chitinophagaceae bacterium]|nr:hypothetical protein [Chitinophagaceae bacterium]MCW5926341.1 hypothetical protein [Chitinophagaceae bacterium]